MEDWGAVEGNSNSVVTVGVPVPLVFAQGLFALLALVLGIGSSSGG